MTLVSSSELESGNDAACPAEAARLVPKIERMVPGEGGALPLNVTPLTTELEFTTGGIIKTAAAVNIAARLPELAEACTVPGAWGNVRDGLAKPAESLVTLRMLSVPLPLTTAKFTCAPGTGAPLASSSETTNGRSVLPGAEL